MKIIIYSIVCYFLLTSSCIVLAQSPDKTTITTLSYNGYMLRNTDSAACFSPQYKALQMAKQLDDKEILIQCYALLSVSCRRTYNVSLMQQYADSAFTLAQKIKTTKGLAFSNMAKGNFESYIDKDAEAVVHLLAALGYFETLNEYRFAAVLAADISYFYSGTDEVKCKKYVDLAVYYADKSKSPDDILKARLAMGSYLFSYNKIAPDSVGSDNYYLKNTVGYAAGNEKTIFIKSNIAAAYLNLAAAYQKANQPQLINSSLQLADSVISICNQYSYYSMLRNAIGLKGNYYMQSGNYAEAEKLFTEGIAFQNSKVNPSNLLLTQFYSSLKELALRKNDYKAFYGYDTLYEHYNKLKYDESALKASQNADASYESSLKNKTISSLEKENRLQRNNKWMGFGAAILLGVVLLLFFRNYHFKQKYFIKAEQVLQEKQKNTELQVQLQEQQTMEALEQKLNMERRLLQSQMDPHFMFNALGNIQSFMLQNDSPKAVSYLSRFSTLMRQMLTQSRKEWVTIEDEVSTLTNYIELQKLRLNNSFTYSITVSSDVDIATEIPPMLIQPFAENAIEHGLKPLGNIRQGVLKIVFIKDTKHNIITCTVKDNGIGIDESKKIKQNSTNTHQSLATEITNERLNKLKKDNAGADVVIYQHVNSHDEPDGTTVLISIPTNDVENV